MPSSCRAAVKDEGRASFSGPELNHTATIKFNCTARNLVALGDDDFESVRKLRVRWNEGGHRDGGLAQRRRFRPVEARRLIARRVFRHRRHPHHRAPFVKPAPRRRVNRRGRDGVIAREILFQKIRIAEEG